MFPERLPASNESEAERRLFDTFKRDFSDDFVVFAGVHWLQKQREGGAEDGEADFVVAHPKYGFLVLEVKGGGIRRDAAAGQWYSTDRRGQEHKIKDPVDQARRSMFALRDMLRRSPATANYSYPHAYAVVFPDVYVEADDPAANYGPDAPAEIIIDAARCRDLKQAVIDVFRFRCAGKEPPGKEAIEALAQLIGPSWRLKTTVGAAIESQEEEIRLLTEQQFLLLDHLSRHRRALISGCAGAGKTMLAIEKARRLARQGYRVLVTCFNQNLEAWLAGQLAPHGVDARRFLKLCHEFAQKAGVPLQKRPGESDEAFFDRFPDALLDALKVLPDRYDAIIVDEGQDFKEEWWAALTELLSDPDDGVLYIFYDDNQRLYRRDAAFPIAGPPFPLTHNCRNTRQIHEAVMMFYQSDQAPGCIGPDGPRPVYLDCAGDERRAIEAEIDRLVTDEKVPPGRIAILTRKSRERSAWSAPPKRPAWSATWDLTEAADKVVISTVHGFKGLERPVVVACELEEVDPLDDPELLYVAFSRAREYLVVAGLKGLSAG
jgi:predicted ATPase